jgi:hypothetical protein
VPVKKKIIKPKKRGRRYAAPEKFAKSAPEKMAGAKEALAGIRSDPAL